MRDEIIRFIQENKLSILGRNNVRSSSYTIFKTKDAKEISQKVLTLISENFVFNDTKQLLKIFDVTQDSKEIEKRQGFFKSIVKIENSHFKKLKRGIPSWKPNYDTVVVTEDESTLVRLKELGCSVVFINQQSDLFNLDRYDLIQFIDCGNFETMLERIPQAIPIDKIEDACLERFLIQLSAWGDNIEELKQSPRTEGLNKVLEELSSILPLINKEEKKPLDFRAIEAELERINEKIISKIKEMTLSGESVVSLLIKGIPKEIRDILEKELSQSHIPRELFQDNIPLKLDEKEVDSFLKKQSTIEFTNSAAEIKKETKKINSIPDLLNRLESELLYQDFISGITKFFEKANSFPRIDNEFNILNSKNLFIENPQPITFNLNQEKRCSILTGANSGGKTTLIEHIIQLISLFQLGFPVSGELSIPFFTEVYYFAKNKGSMSKGAFENLLTQMSEIQPGESTLILADEIEAVTEPGVAGEIIVSTAEYFIEKNCFLVIATHLGQEVQHLLPEKCRIDGIEAKGLTENYELIVDHNPVLGKLANSTPELIIEKMAKAQQKPYFTWLFENLKGRNGQG
jgi:DNA mismatch repair protein MutS2